MQSILSLLLMLLLVLVGHAFQVNPHAKPHPRCSTPLFMGRAAAVRAATKAKTDAKKAKTNAIFGKKVIMAVKNGGGPDPEANTLLRDVLKAAKANSVPVDVSVNDASVC